MASLEMGTDDRRLVLKFIIEAEAAGILGVACPETLQAANEI